LDVTEPATATLPEVWTNIFRVANDTVYVVVTWQGFFDVRSPTVPWVLNPRAGSGAAPATADISIAHELYTAGTTITLLYPGGNSTTTTLDYSPDSRRFSNTVRLERGACVMLWKTVNATDIGMI
jgi:hypothetical protein